MYVLPVIWFFIAVPTASSLSIPMAAPGPFYDPRILGGSMLDDAGPGGGEPMNIIISSQSSPPVLTNAGFLNFAGALGFATECMGMHMGAPQSANLGDGNGWVNQTMELREDYGFPGLGTCWESLAGGNHLRMYRQDGPLANSGALFLAVSKEEDATKHHTISPNGYDAGRDLLVGHAAGKLEFKGTKYAVSTQRIEGLGAKGAAGVNHGIATDGGVVLLTVKVL
ncbi:hypothetical protein C8F01DRAFT_1141084 [Mycena amicta]|nr:hypothetical protein C8F01DRAFT_1141084 [Mycena amicta]